MEDDKSSNLKESIPLLSSTNHQLNPLYEGLKQKISPLSQGLYMKHLLKHLTTPNLTISEIFARLYSSFTQGDFYIVVFIRMFNNIYFIMMCDIHNLLHFHQYLEEDLSVLDSQRPEVKQSTEPFRLDASLRRATCTHLHRLFFNMTR